jgi:hypothetical protein
MALEGADSATGKFDQRGLPWEGFVILELVEGD